MHTGRKVVFLKPVLQWPNDKSRSTNNFCPVCWARGVWKPALPTTSLLLWITSAALIRIYWNPFLIRSSFSPLSFLQFVNTTVFWVPTQMFCLRCGGDLFRWKVCCLSGGVLSFELKEYAIWCVGNEQPYLHKSQKNRCDRSHLAPEAPRYLEQTVVQEDQKLYQLLFSIGHIRPNFECILHSKSIRKCVSFQYLKKKTIK